jgi:Tfp pilus assembly protein PilN
MQNTITELTAEKAQLIANEVVLRSNIDTVKANLKAEREANAANMATIDKLLEDRKDAQQQIKKLADLKAKNKRASDALNKNVEEMLKKDPKNNGPLSPVLKETIRGIQRQ